MKKTLEELRQFRNDLFNAGDYKNSKKISDIILTLINENHQQQISQLNENLKNLKVFKSF